MAVEERAAPEDAPVAKTPNTPSKSKVPTLRPVARPNDSDALTPRRAVLGTTEVLENILSFLPLETLFGVQRVCRGWKDLIARSRAIQEKMFLRLRNDTSETWMLTDPKFVPCNVGDLPYDSELNFRMVSTAEVESGSWRNNAAGVLHLYKPVILNPLLHRDEDSLIGELQQGVGHAFSVAVGGPYARHHSFRDMYLTDPPCKGCRMDLTYEENRPAPNGYYYRGCQGTVRSSQPLTLGDVIDGALNSLDMFMGKESTVGTGGRYDQAISEDDFLLARQTDEVGKCHGYRLVFQNHRDGIGLPIDEFTFRPLLLTVAEYQSLRPAKDLSQ